MTLNREQRRALAIVAKSHRNGCSPLALAGIFTLETLDSLESAGLIARHEVKFSNPPGLKAERYRITDTGKETIDLRRDWLRLTELPGRQMAHRLPPER